MFRSSANVCRGVCNFKKMQYDFSFDGYIPMKINPGFEISTNRHKNCSATFVCCSAVFLCCRAVLSLCRRTSRTAQGCIGRSGVCIWRPQVCIGRPLGCNGGPHGCMRAASGAVLGGLEVVLGGLWGCIEQPRGCIGRPRGCIERVRGCIGRRVFTCACRVQWLSFETNLGVYFHHGLVFSWWRPAARNSKHHNPAHVIANLLHSPVMMFGSGQFLLLQNFACAPDTFFAHKT